MRTAFPVAGLLAGLVLAACGGDASPGPGPSGASCPGGSTLTYASFGAPFFSAHCTTCHGTPPSGGAPAHADFTTLAAIKDHAALIDEKAAAGPARTNVAMPPVGGVALGERRQLGEWLACGAPP